MRVSDALTSGRIGKSEAEILLAALFGQDRTRVLAHPEREFTVEQEVLWKDWEARRERGEPVAHIIGTKEFYGRGFSVGPSVLIPRPATERLVEIALALLGNASGPVAYDEEIDAEISAMVDIWKPLAEVACVADVGTGSGCIAVTVALERPDLRVIATDVSEDALRVAKGNAKSLHAGRIEFLHGAGLEPLSTLTEPFLLVSNPPYIPDAADLEKDVRDFEPHLALFGGTDGADVIRTIVTAAKKHPFCHGYVIECRTDQCEAVD